MGFSHVRLKSTSICSVGEHSSIFFFTSPVYELTNLFFIKCFAYPFTGKSSGWKKCVVFAGTVTNFMFRKVRLQFKDPKTGKLSEGKN